MPFSTAMDITAANAALKELYDGQVVENLVYADNPFLALVPKNEEFGGKSFPLPVVTGVSMGRASKFANAQANRSAAQIKAFALTRVSDYSIARITNEALMASRTDKMSFLQDAKVVIDGAIRAATLSLASSLFRSGSGSIGQISSISTGVITLVNPADAVQFEVNMVLNAAATDGGASRGPGTKGYVVAVDRTLGTVTVATSAGGSAASPAAWAGSDFLVCDGDSAEGSTFLKISGLAAWLPSSAPSSTAFFGVDRSVDATRLGGIRYDGSGQSIEEALVDASMLVAREGGKPTHCFMSFASYGALEKALGTKVQYADMKGGPRAEIAFRGIVINGANSQITVIPDRNCPPLTGYLLQLDTWKLYSLGSAPDTLTYADGVEMLRVADADEAEFRSGYYAQLGTNAPGWNANVKLGA